MNTGRPLDSRPAIKLQNERFRVSPRHSAEVRRPTLVPTEAFPDEKILGLEVLTRNASSLKWGLTRSSRLFESHFGQHSSRGAGRSRFYPAFLAASSLFLFLS